MSIYPGTGVVVPPRAEDNPRPNVPGLAITRLVDSNLRCSHNIGMSTVTTDLATTMHQKLETWRRVGPARRTTRVEGRPAIRGRTSISTCSCIGLFSVDEDGGRPAGWRWRFCRQICIDHLGIRYRMKQREIRVQCLSDKFVSSRLCMSFCTLLIIMEAESSRPDFPLFFMLLFDKARLRRRY